MKPSFLPFPHLRRWLAAVLALTAWLLPAEGRAQHELLTIGNYYWYAPDHEKYAPTVFYSAPQFNARQVRITRTQRFKLTAGQRNWFMLEFDQGGKLFIPIRLLRSMVHDQSAPDTWSAFERASVFFEDPAKLEARMRSARNDPQALPGADTKVPSWKRYKDSWGLNKPGSRPGVPTVGTQDGGESTASTQPGRLPERKAKSKYPLLPPIGSEPKQEDAAPTEPPAGDGTNVPQP